MSLALGLLLAERGFVPTGLVRLGIRRLLAQRLAQESRRGVDEILAAQFETGPIALNPAVANEQHYEVPPEFFELVLGPNLKYSSAYWPNGVGTLGDAEAAMLALTCERAQLADGQEILELGCGWGSLSLHMARRFPESRILAVSNSVPQRRYIEARAPRNLEVVTADMNDFQTGRRFDRVVSVEMFEHMRNYRELFDRIAGWLRIGGKLFVHVFCHRHYAYAFETEGAGNWMGRQFFTAGLMPSFGLLPRFDHTFSLEDRWAVDGTHYQRTAAAWRENLERNKKVVLEVLASSYGAGYGRWYHRWRLFFLACEELFGYHGGTEWLVGHYLFSPQQSVESGDSPGRFGRASVSSEPVVLE